MRTVSLYFPFFKTAVTPTFIYMNDNGEGEQQQRGNELSWPATSANYLDESNHRKKGQTRTSLGSPVKNFLSFHFIY